MALIRIQLDLAIPSEVAQKTAVKAKLLELYALIKLAKSYSVKINEGLPNEEMTVRAVYHICRHDEGLPCEPVVEIQDVENTEEFESWLFKLIHDAKMKLCLSDKTIAYILLREGTNYYFKDIAGRELGDNYGNNDFGNHRAKTQ